MLDVYMLAEYIMALGLSLLFSAITVFFRDMEHILSIITMAWIYLTPVLYPIDMIADQKIQKLFYLNPMTSVIVAYRDILYYAKVPDFSTLGMAFIFGIMNGKTSVKKGYIEGLKLGGLIILILMILNLIFYRKFSLNIFIYYLIIIASSTFGSVIGINLGKK